MQNKMKNSDYNKRVQEKSPASKIYKNCFNAFWIGGLICTVGQIVTNFLKSAGQNPDMATAGTAIIMIFLGALLTGLNLYDNIAKVGGAGTIVPITGFSNAIVSPAMEFKSEGFILGMGAKMFVIAGPVLVYGTVSSIIAGVIIYIWKMLGGVV